MKKPLVRPYLISIALLAGAVLVSIAIGSVSIPPREFLGALFSGTQLGEAAQVFRSIIVDLRLPHIVLLVLIGAALAPAARPTRGCSATRWLTPI